MRQILDGFVGNASVWRKRKVRPDMSVSALPLSHIRRVAHWALCAFFLLAALLYAWATLCAILNFGWRQPMFDQWREYEIFLGDPFPLNVLQAASGHRPIFPNLLRVAEIQWLHANQYLQLSVGTFCAFATAAIIAAVGWTEKRLPLLARCACIMLAVLGLLWLGNARRLMHGSESLHGYLPTLAVLLACLCTYATAQRRSFVLLCAASAACVVATFSFGVGLASFVCVLVLGAMLRLPVRWLLVPLATLGVCLALYVFVLPDGQNVRAQVSTNLIEGAVVTAQWLSSPWCYVWLSLAEYGAGPWPGHHSALERLLQQSAADLVAISGLGWRTWGGVFGTAGIAALAWFVLPRLHRTKPLSRLEAVAAGLAIYGAVSAVLSVFPRIEFFHAHPDQVFADRYTTWPCLFWLGLSLLAVARIAESTRPLLKVAGVFGLILLPIVMAISQRDQTIWSLLVYRSSQQTAASLRSGIFDEAHFPGEKLGVEAHMREVALLRNRRLAMFADPGWQQVGEIWQGSLETEPGVAARACWLQPVLDYPTQRNAGHLEGSVTQGKRRVYGKGMLAILDDDHRIAGLAEFSHATSSDPDLTYRVRSKRGFDGYVRDVDEAKKYSVALLNSSEGRGIMLGPVDPRCE